MCCEFNPHLPGCQPAVARLIVVRLRDYFCHRSSADSLSFLPAQKVLMDTQQVIELGGEGAKLRASPPSVGVLG